MGVSGVSGGTAPKWRQPADGARPHESGADAAPKVDEPQRHDLMVRPHAVAGPDEHAPQG